MANASLMGVLTGVTSETARTERSSTSIITTANNAEHDLSRMSESVVRDHTAVMTAYHMGERTGCAYYTSEYRELFLVEDVPQTIPFEDIQYLLGQVEPTTIILCDDNADLLAAVEETTTGNSISIEKLPRKEFNLARGKHTLLGWYADIQKPGSQATREHDEDDASSASMHMEVDMPEETTCEDPYDSENRQAYLQLSCHINWESYAMVSCAGLLLRHLEHLDNTDDTENENGTDRGTRPLSLRKVKIGSFMQVSSETYRSLHVFEQDAHPSAHQKRGKESLSLFGLLDQTVSPMGHHLLQEWLMRPTMDMALLECRHRSVGFFAEEESSDLMQNLRACLKHIKNVPRVLSRIREQCASPNEWQQFLQFVFYAIQIRGHLKKYFTIDLPVIRKVQLACNLDMLRKIGSTINAKIDFTQSRDENRVVIKDDVDEELDELKRQYCELEYYLLEVAEQVAKNLPVGIGAACNVVYFPQLGYLVTVPIRFESRLVTMESEWEGASLQFSTSDYMYYKEDKTRELDHSVGDIYAEMMDKEVEIVQELSSELAGHLTDLLEIADLCAELDCLLSFAKVARQQHYVRPQMTDKNNSLIIKEGRHPMQELCIDIFIPNDTYLMGGVGLKQEDDKRTSDPGKDSSIFTGHSSFFASPDLVETAARDPYASGNDVFVEGMSANMRKPADIMEVERQNESNDGTTLGLDSILLLSGANFSGKSVYLHQAALIVYMAQVGSFVPAKEARIGLTDRIFTRIQTMETVAKMQSAFSSDIEQLAHAVHEATENSLVIIDEFGKGTDACDGAALLAAILGYFVCKGSHCPKILVSTHFHELITYGVLNEKHGISFYTTEVLNQPASPSVRSVEPSVSHDVSMSTAKSSRLETVQEEVVFLYKVVPRHQAKTESYGAWCASLAGIEPSVVKRAVELSELLSHGDQIRMRTTKEDEERYDQLQTLIGAYLWQTNDTTEAEQIGLTSLILRMAELCE